MLRSERLILRPLVAEDVDWITSSISDEQVMRWLSQPPWPYARSDAEAYLASGPKAPETLAIVADRPVGSITLRAGTSGGLGFWLARSAWGNGYMTEAVRTRLAHHFASSDEDVHSSWLAGNASSAAVHHKLGFATLGSGEAFFNYHGRSMPVETAAISKRRFEEVNGA